MRRGALGPGCVRAVRLAGARVGGIPFCESGSKKTHEPLRRTTTMADSISTDKLIDNLNAVIRDAETLLKATAAQTGETIQQARKRAEESVRQAKERLAGVEEEALKRARALADEADVFVRDKPWQAVGVAAGLGLILGLLISRR
jgi:ElaB/YqjD/DUF883 family membrane-anchored ribosome-binding protein